MEIPANARDRFAAHKNVAGVTTRGEGVFLNIKGNPPKSVRDAIEKEAKRP